MNDPFSLKALKKQVHVLPTDELRRRFAVGIRIIRENLLENAAILLELEERKEKIEGDTNLINYLRRIGKGELLVDIIVRFAGRPYTMASIARLPVEEQAALLEEDNATVEAKFAKPSPRKAPTVSPHGRPTHNPLDVVTELAHGGTAKDVAEMCLELVRACEDPVAVAELVLPELQRIKQEQRSPRRAPA